MSTRLPNGIAISAPITPEYAQILTSDKLPSTLVQKKEFASHILKSGRHLLTLINEILDLAKIESGAVALSTPASGLTSLPRPERSGKVIGRSHPYPPICSAGASRSPAQSSER